MSIQVDVKELETQENPPLGEIKGKWVCPQCQYPVDWTQRGFDDPEHPMFGAFQTMGDEEKAKFAATEQSAFREHVDGEIQRHWRGTH